MNYVEQYKRDRKTIKRLHEQIRALETEKRTLEGDRDLFREHFVSRFNWWAKLLTDGGRPSLPWLLQDDAMWLRRFKYWWFEANHK